MAFVIISVSGGCSRNNIPAPINTLPKASMEPAEAISKRILPKGLIVAVVAKDYGTIFLVEVDTGLRHKFDIQGETAINIYGWSNNGCSLIVETETDRIVKADIEGNIITDIVKVGKLNFEGEMIQTSISPDEKWIAIVSGTGNQEFTSYEFQNLVTFYVQNQSSEIYKLTNSGLVNGIAWSPDSNLLAYNDNDIHGVQQIFISHPSGSNKFQLTHFESEGLVIRSLKWSPSGEKIAFAVINEEMHESYLGLIEISSDNHLKYISSIAGVGEFWWASDDILVADILPSGKNPDKITDRAISWYDASTGEQIGKLDTTNLPNGSFEAPGPLAFSDKMGFFSNGGFYVFDMSSSQIEHIFNKFIDIRYWISGPQSDDIESCNLQK